MYALTTVVPRPLDPILHSHQEAKFKGIAAKADLFGSRRLHMSESKRASNVGRTATRAPNRVVLKLQASQQIDSWFEDSAAIVQASEIDASAHE